MIYKDHIFILSYELMTFQSSRVNNYDCYERSLQFTVITMTLCFTNKNYYIH